VKRNKFSKALKHLKSTELDEKLQRLNEAPTNSIGGVYALNQPGQRLGLPDLPKVYYPDVDGNWPDGIPGVEGEKAYTRPAGYWDYGPGAVPSVDWDKTLDFSHSDTSTDGFINPTTGEVLSDLPPDSSSFILGPLVDGYTYNHGYDDYTNIGYIQKDTRQFILLARIQGYWKSGSAGNAGAGRNPVREWGGESDGFHAFNENFTLAMAQWFRDQYVNGTYTRNVSYFYNGGQPQVGNQDPNAPSGSKGGIVGGAGNGGSAGDGPFGSGGDPNIGTPQNAPNHGGPEDAGFPWGLFNDLKDLLFGKKKKKPDEKYGPAFGDDETANRERDELIRELEKNMDQYGDDPKVEKAVNDWNDALYKAGGGDAAQREKGQTRDDVIDQGRKNLGLPPKPTTKSGSTGFSGSTGPTGGESGEFGPGRQRGFRLPGFGAKKSNIPDDNKTPQKWDPNAPWAKGGYGDPEWMASQRGSSTLSSSDFTDKAEYDAYKAGGGNAARKNGLSVDDIIAQGRKNIQNKSGDVDSKSNAELQRLMSKPPGTHTPAEKQKLLDAGLDDFVKGGQTASPLGDLAMLGATAAVVKGALALGLSGLTKLGLTATGITLGNQAKETFVDKADNADQYNKQLAGKLVTSIVSGQPQEIKLSPAAKKDQIKNVDQEQFAQALQIGSIQKPSANSTVNPTQKRPVLTGGWGAQGGSEVRYDPKTDTLTITSEKMLRTGLEGDEFGTSQYGHPLNPITYQKQTRFGDIPEPTDAQVSDMTKKLMTGPLEPLMQGLSGVAQSLDKPVNASNFTGGPLPGREPTGGNATTWDEIKSDPIKLQTFSDNMGKAANDLAKGAVQGTASNTVAIRKVLTNLGFPQSEVEKTGGGYGQVYSQTSYKGNEIPQELRNIINNKTGVKESFNLTESRKRILREIKQPYKLPEQPKQKYKMNFKGKFRPQNTPDVTASKQTDEGVKAQNAAGQTWRTKDKHWSRYQSQERMNVIYDHIGHGNMYWDMIVNENQNKKGTRDRQIQEYLNIIAHEKAMLQEDPNYVSPFRQKIEEQETLQADKDPLFKKVASRLKTEIDYPDKPSKKGYPDTPPPEMVNGFHPEYGNKGDYYNKLDPQSAEAMPKTGNAEIDAKVQKAKRLKKILGKKG